MSCILSVKYIHNTTFFTAHKRKLHSCFDIVVDLVVIHQIQCLLRTNKCHVSCWHCLIIISMLFSSTNRYIIQDRRGEIGMKWNLNIEYWFVVLVSRFSGDDMYIVDFSHKSVQNEVFVRETEISKATP